MQQIERSKLCSFPARAFCCVLQVSLRFKHLYVPLKLVFAVALWIYELSQMGQMPWHEAPTNMTQLP